MGFVLLEGGDDFSGGMATADRRAMEVCGGSRAPVRIIPAAAAPDQNHARAGAKATAWFQALGAADVKAVGIIDRASAERRDLADEVANARLVFLLGGNRPDERWAGRALDGIRKGGRHPLPPQQCR